MNVLKSIFYLKIFLNKTYDSRETTDSLENTVDDEDELVEDEEVRTILEGITEDTTYHNQKSQELLND